MGSGSRRNSLRLQESKPKSLTIEVLSSQSKVAITVDGATVSYLPPIPVNAAVSVGVTENYREQKLATHTRLDHMIFF